MQTGFCSRCHKIWTLETEQGRCQWCGSLATSITVKAQALRSLKTSRRGRQKQAWDYGNGYGQLSGEWHTYYEVASQHSRKAKPQDRGDLVHNIMLTLAQVDRNRNGDGPLTVPAMHRIASRVVADYWRTEYKHGNGVQCGQCSKAQKAECRKRVLYPAHPSCPKAVAVESLSKPIVDGEGNTTELGGLIADDRAIDLDAWLDAKTFLRGCPQRLIAIARKRANGDALSNADMIYLCKWRKRQQLSLTTIGKVSPPNPDICSGSTV